jgi:hypothetical protein
MPPVDPLDQKPHDEAESMLPWYAIGQLEESDRVRVEAHLASCAHCREQLSIERRLMREFRAITPQIESGWSRIKARIQTPAAPLSRGRSVLDWFPALVPQPALARLAMAQLGFVVIAAGVLLSLGRPSYHALGSAPVPASANVIVMFKPDAKVASLDQTLRSAGASIVDGPTDANAYLLHVEPSRRAKALARLRSVNMVQLAQPIDGVAQ